MDRFLNAFDSIAKKTTSPGLAGDAEAASPTDGKPPAPAPPVPGEQCTVADHGQLEEVVQLLRSIVKKAEEEHSALQQQVASLEKDVAFWKQESFSAVRPQPSVHLASRASLFFSSFP